MQYVTVLNSTNRLTLYESHVPHRGLQRKNTSSMARPLTTYSLLLDAPDLCRNQRKCTNGVDSSHSRKPAPAQQQQQQMRFDETTLLLSDATTCDTNRE
jgi:hypothetical protein